MSIQMLSRKFLSNEKDNKKVIELSKKQFTDRFNNGRNAGVLFEEFILDPANLKYIKYLIFSANHSDAINFREFVRRKADELSEECVTPCTDIERYIAVLHSLYPDGYYFFRGKHANQLLSNVIETDRQYVIWFVSTALQQRDSSDVYWTSENGFDILCMMMCVS